MTVKVKEQNRGHVVAHDDVKRAPVGAIKKSLKAKYALDFSTNLPQ